MQVEQDGPEANGGRVAFGQFKWTFALAARCDRRVSDTRMRLSWHSCHIMATSLTMGSSLIRVESVRLSRGAPKSIFIKHAHTHTLTQYNTDTLGIVITIATTKRHSRLSAACQWPTKSTRNKSPLCVQIRSVALNLSRQSESAVARVGLRTQL